MQLPSETTARTLRPFVLLGLALAGLAACSAPSAPGPAAADPREGEVPLPAAHGWRASLVLDAGVGVWTVAAAAFLPQTATPEVLACDDRGRLWVVTSYSGRWTPVASVHDGRWLGGLTVADVDPRIPGVEAYAGGARGSLHQVVGYPEGTLDHRRIAHFPGLELHTLVAGDLDPRVPGPELVAFTDLGDVYRLSPNAPDGRFAHERIATLPGRVRGAVLLPAPPGTRPRLATVSRDGRLSTFWIEPDGVHQEVLLSGEQSFGRIARAPGSGVDGRPLVLYATLDDGRILRLERTPDGFRSETIHVTAQGPRGIVGGRFTPDPDVESLAVYGYSGRVELLTRAGERWSATTLFVDDDKGHWLTAAELDGRNACDELLLSGYGGRVVLLARE